MNGLFTRMLWLSGMGILFGVVAWAGKSVEGHLSDSKCQECHLSAKVEPDKAGLLIASQEKLCARCHPKAIQMSHPSGFAPMRSLPTAFPLDWKGELTCGSCHQVHGSQPGLPRTSAKGADLCRACHDEEFFARLPGPKKDAARLVHQGALPPAPVTVELDILSVGCMGCHDDKGGTAQNRVGLNAKGVMRHMGNALSHPLGGLYAIVTQLGAYRPAASLPANVLLKEGKVGCVSCHEQYGSQQHGGLIVTDYESICHACHVQ